MSYLNIVGYIDHLQRLKYTKILTECFDYVLENVHSMPTELLEMEGMSGRKYRQFVNLLVSKLKNPRYLEIGVWQGSTLCSAIWNNIVTATACDNWSQFGEPRSQFMQNINAVQNGKNPVSVLEQDFRTIDYANIGKFNLYMFDGPHEEQDQYDGVVLAMPALDDEFIMVVDDWNHPYVKNGTQRAIADLGLIVDCIHVDTSADGTHPSPAFQYSDWHNGYFIASVKKPLDKA